MDIESKNLYKHLKFISYLQIIGIILVVLGHSFYEYPDGAFGYNTWFSRLIYNVHMPIFTFVSGYLLYFTSFMVGRRERTWREFVKAKINRLLLPYLTLSLITFVPRALLSSIAEDTIELSLDSLLHSLIYADKFVIPYFWYLHMSFILIIGVYVILRLVGRNDRLQDVVICALCIIFILLPLSDVQFSTIFAIHKVVMLGLYFLLGIIYCKYSSCIDRSLNTSSLVTVIVSATIWIVLFFTFEDNDLSRLASVFGILSFVALTHILEIKHIKIFDHLMGATYIIFLLSWYINVASQQALAHFVVLPWWVHTLLSFVGGIYIPWLGYKYLETHTNSRWVRVTAFLLGQNMKKIKA